MSRQIPLGSAPEVDLLVQIARILGSRGWFYMLVAGLFLAPLWLLRVNLARGVDRQVVWHWAAMDDTSYLFIGIGFQVLFAVLVLATVPYFVLVRLSKVRGSAFGWFAGSLPLGVGAAFAAGMLAPAAVVVAALVWAFSWPLSLTLVALCAHAIAHWLLRSQTRAIGLRLKTAAVRQHTGSSVGFQVISVLASIVFLGGYFGLQFGAFELASEFISEQWVNEVTAGRAYLALGLAEVLCLVLWSVVTCVAWHRAYGTVALVEKQELAETFA